jgi:hypothetical protein
MTRIVVLSDTHVPAARPFVPQTLLAAIGGADLVLHAGDSCCRAALNAFESVAPLAAVHGNVDPPDLQAALPSARVVECGGIRIGMTHGHYGTRATTPERAPEIFANVKDLHVIVFGHSHIPLLERHDGLLLFNPGSAMQPRSQTRPSIGLLEVQDGADLWFHDCGELTDAMISGFCTLDPAVLSLGSSRPLWEVAPLVPKTTVLYGNLPSKKFYSDTAISLEHVREQAEEIVSRLGALNQPFILGTECDVLNVPGSESVIWSKVEALLAVGRRAQSVHGA